MPGTVFEVTLEEALVIVEANRRDPELLRLRYGANASALVAESERMIEAMALEVAARCLEPPRPQPVLKIVRGD